MKVKRASCNRRRFIEHSTLGFAAAAFFQARGARPSAPNIVLIIADDLGWNDCSPYGHPTVKTPNLNRLAAQGMRFQNAFVTTSSCSPSRASMITGLYPHATNAEQLHWPLPGRNLTFVELLKKAGYWTAAAGKWHLGDEVRNRFDQIKEADPAGYQLPVGKDADKTTAQVTKGDAQSGCADWISTLRDRPKDKPFFVWLAALDPHRDYQKEAIPNPHLPEGSVVPPYLPDVPETRADLALYYDEVSRLDRFVGEVLEELARQGQDENTIVAFISDNGRPFPRDKTTLYDGGIRTPLMIRWPGRIKKGTICAALASSVDLAPTFLHAAGVPVPKSFHGRSLIPLLDGPKGEVQDYIFAEDHWHDFEDLGRAVRSRRFKYIRNYYPDLPNTPPADAVRSPTYQAMRRLRDEGKLPPEQMRCFEASRPPEELYDTQADPDELKNLAGNSDYRQVLNQFRTELIKWQERTQDRLPVKRTPDEFDRETGEPLPNRKRPRPSKEELGLGG
ncbi:MAG: heparan N-sulfatase [Acidobacteria bacterium]|nr:MAG: heparan N-sulfatase [Acidobacteriota bacterium]